jgi:predicted  nucleic acid-binding Zn-ribbon protein
MHPELAAVIKLWENVHKADRLQHERLLCVDQRKETATDLAAKTEAKEAARVHLDQLRTEERRVMRKLDAYRKRVATTRTMIDTGKAPDYRLAEQQLRNCTEMVDQLETEALELMEQRDEAEQTMEAAEQAYEQARQAAEAAVIRQRDRIPEIDRALEDLDLTRPALEAALAPEHKGPFRVLRSRKRYALSELHEGACRRCNYGAPSQVVNEIEANQRVHTCRNCGRFLLPSSAS